MTGLVGTWMDLRRSEAETAVIEALTTHHDLPELHIRTRTRLRAARVRRALTDLGDRGVITNIAIPSACSDRTPIRFYRLAGDQPVPRPFEVPAELVKLMHDQVAPTLDAEGRATAARRREAAANPDVWRVGGSDPIDSVTVYQGTRFVGSTRTHADAVFLVAAANYLTATDPNGHSA